MVTAFLEDTHTFICCFVKDYRRPYLSPYHTPYQDLPEMGHCHVSRRRWADVVMWMAALSLFHEPAGRSLSGKKKKEVWMSEFLGP